MKWISYRCLVGLLSNMQHVFMFPRSIFDFELDLFIFASRNEYLVVLYPPLALKFVFLKIFLV